MKSGQESKIHDGLEKTAFLRMVFQGPLYRILACVVIASLVIDLAGCASLRRKFVRKKKAAEDETEGMVVSPQEYPPFSYSQSAAYESYYYFWKGWHEELLRNMDFVIYRKKRQECMREVIANLTQLQVLLPAEEKPLLQAHIDSLTKIQDRLQQRSLSSSTLYTLKREVEQIYRKLVKGFSPQSRKRVEDSEKVSSGTK